jgi:transposase
MRRPSSLVAWFTTTDQLKVWVHAAPDKAAYQRRLAIWLTHVGPFSANRVSELLAVSTQAVWKWIAEYNKMGPTGLDRKGRGGRRWGLMPLDEERKLLSRFLVDPESGAPLTAAQLRSILSGAVGREISIHYVYKVLRRHPWRSLTRQSVHAIRD